MSYFHEVFCVVSIVNLNLKKPAPANPREHSVVIQLKLYAQTTALALRILLFGLWLFPLQILQILWPFSP
jgi:hypothetical protein